MGKELLLRNSLRSIGILCLIVTILIYVQFQARNILVGPAIEVESSSGVVLNHIVPITGNAQNIVELRINNKIIHTNEVGDFNEYIILPAGYSIVTITATDRFGRTKSLTKEYVYSPLPREV